MSQLSHSPESAPNPDRGLIRDATPEDVTAICQIYNHYVAKTIITFEETPVSEAEMMGRMEEVKQQYPWIVYEADGKVLGYAYGSRWKGRCAFRFAVESTVYLSAEATGGGIGTALYEELLDRLRVLELHTVIGGIALPNPASIALHEKMGMTKVAHFPEVGYKQGQWLDVGYWQLTFEST